MPDAIKAEEPVNTTTLSTRYCSPDRPSRSRGAPANLLESISSMSGLSQKLILALLFIGVLMGALDLAIIGPALPAIQSEFMLDNRNLSWLFNVYVLAQLLGTPLFAKASDKYGRRNVYMVCVAGFGLGSLMLVLATRYETLLLGRAVQGLGASGIFRWQQPLSATLFPGETGQCPGHDRRSIRPCLSDWASAGRHSAALCMAVVIYPQSANRRWLAGGGMATFAIGGSKQLLPFDWLGGAILSALLACLAVGITNFDTADSWSSLTGVQVWPFMLTGLVLVPLFWATEKTPRTPS